MRGDHRRYYYEAERRRALCRLQGRDDGRLVPRDLTKMELLGLAAAVLVVIVFLLLLKAVSG